MVKNQQRVILSTAKRSNAIISSLFPSNVRDKIYRTEIDDIGQKKRNSQSGASPSVSSAPIAELYPDTTVLFAGKFGR